MPLVYSDLEYSVPQESYVYGKIPTGKTVW